MSLKILAIGTGRDGTTSLTTLLQHIYAKNHKQLNSKHEWRGIEGYNHMCSYYENHNSESLKQLRYMIERWNVETEAIIGNGYAFYLNEILSIYGDELKIIHLKREDKEACIQSLIKNARLFPHFHGYYSPLAPQDCQLRRVTAFHLKEMSRKEWEELSIHEKFSWYYDKTHQLIDEQRSKITQYHYVATEELNNEDSLMQLTQFLSKDFTKQVKPVNYNCYNRFIAIEKLPEIYHLKAQWYLKQFNILKNISNPLYPLQFFGNMSLSFIKHCMTLPMEKTVPFHKDWLWIIINQIQHILKLTRNFLEYDEQSLFREYPLPESNQTYLLTSDLSRENIETLSYFYETFDVLNFMENDSYPIHFFCVKIAQLLANDRELFQKRKAALIQVLQTLTDKINYLILAFKTTTSVPKSLKWIHEYIPVVIYDPIEGFKWILKSESSEIR